MCAKRVFEKSSPALAASARRSSRVHEAPTIARRSPLSRTRLVRPSAVSTGPRCPTAPAPTDRRTLLNSRARCLPPADCGVPGFIRARLPSWLSLLSHRHPLLASAPMSASTDEVPPAIDGLLRAQSAALRRPEDATALTVDDALTAGSALKGKVVVVTGAANGFGRRTPTRSRSSGA